MKKKKKLTEQDKAVLNFLKQGGRAGARQDFMGMITLAVKPSKKKQK